MKKLISLLQGITEHLNWVALVVLLTSMSLLVTGDATMRYIIGRPIKWGTDVSCIMLTTIVFFSMAKCWRDKGHIRMTILYDVLGSKGKDILDALAAVAGLFFWGFLLYQSIIDIEQAITLNEVTDDIGIILWPIRTLISIGLLMFVLEMLVSLLKSFRLLINGTVRE